MTHPPIAQLDAATKHYGKVTALADVDLRVTPGEVVALLGPNGAGKTTAVSLLLGLLRPTRGDARLFGLDPRARAARVRTGALLQIAKVPETLKVREHVEQVSAYYPDPLPLERTFALAGLHGLEDRLFGKLSGGQKQRLLFALAICGNPQVLFLDEPTAGLDVEARRALWRAVRELVDDGRTVFLTTHHLEEADALASRVVVLDQGRIVAEGTPDEVKGRVVGRRIRCRTATEATRVAAWPGVESVHALDDGRLELLVQPAEPVVRRLLDADPALDELEVLRAGLEEALLHLTRRQIDTDDDARDGTDAAAA